VIAKVSIAKASRAMSAKALVVEDDRNSERATLSLIYRIRVPT
jgi:hypothetical protein